VDNNINSIGIIGSGYIGAQLSLHFATFNKDIVVFEPSQQSIDTSKKMHNEELDSRIASGKITTSIKANILNNITFINDITKIPTDTNLIIEAVPEDLALKQKVFAKLEKICCSDTIIATNSSSISISKIEKVVKNKHTLLNMHFYPPVWDRPIVELMKGCETSNDVINKVVKLAKQTDLIPLVTKKESMGFIFNRIWHAIKKEAMHVANEGIATIEDVDRAWMVLLNYPIGPFGLMDMVGLDVIKDVFMSYYHETGKQDELPPAILTEKIERGDLGRKTGKGFYNYPNPAFTDPNWLKNPDITNEL
jgi:3-hydroxybutyryl-CoA dehydrogenase